jgi:hypothetical protein
MVNHLPILAREYAERAAESERVRTEVDQMLSNCFREAVARVGEEEARKSLHRATKRKGVKPLGSTDKARDERLLSFYSELVVVSPNKRSRSAAARLVGERLARVSPGKYGPSASAITRQLRRLLKRRQVMRSGTWNALVVITRTGKLPVGEPPWSTDK